MQTYPKESIYCMRYYQTAATKKNLIIWMSDLISVRLHIDRPLVCVSVLLSLFPEVAGYVSKHDRLHNGDSLSFTATQIIRLINPVYIKPNKVFSESTIKHTASINCRGNG